MFFFVFIIVSVIVPLVKVAEVRFLFILIFQNIRFSKYKIKYPLVTASIVYIKIAALLQKNLSWEDLPQEIVFYVH